MGGVRDGADGLLPQSADVNGVQIRELRPSDTLSRSHHSLQVLPFGRCAAGPHRDAAG